MEKKRTNNPNGRPKGVPNKTTSIIRERISNIISSNMELFETDITSLAPADRMEVIIKLLPYAIPRIVPIQEDDDYKESTGTSMDNTKKKLEQLNSSLIITEE